jgi:SAM-dependent methyltransferase
MEFLSDLTLRVYFRESIFRHLTDRFLERHGAAVTGTVVEIGGEERYDNQRFFPNATNYLLSNIGRSVADTLDVTDLHEFADGSQETFVCTSVLQHVVNLEAAFSEMARTLRPGGTAILVVPLLFPVTDVFDCWRFSRNSIDAVLGPGFDVEVTKLGGKISTIALLLQRPRRKWNRRTIPLKLLGACIVVVFGRFDQPDDSPPGWGIVARRTSGPYRPLSAFPNRELPW